jgi:predicted SAM-dependent methyltransferase
MTLNLNVLPNSKIVELGGGANPRFRPNVDVRMCHDAQGNQTVDFTADFDKSLPMKSDEWDAVFSQYVIEHVSYRAVRGFIAEVFRILKPGGKAVFVTANTPAQLQWIANNPSGWDNRDFFDSASGLLFGDQDYPENTHKNYMSAIVAEQLFTAAGFSDVKTHQYGERNTDMVIEAVKPANAPGAILHVEDRNHVPTLVPTPEPPQRAANAIPEGMTREQMFDKEYFNGGGKVGGYSREGYRDFPVHEVTARHILARKPASALEIGSGRNYIVKRLQDAGIEAVGLEISKHCFLTRAADSLINIDLCEDWKSQSGWCTTITEMDKFDLCYSVATLEHIPTEFIPHVIREMAKYSERGLHGIDFGGADDGWDKTHFTLRDRTWWHTMFAEHAPGYPVEIVDKELLERGEFPPEVLHGDGKVKLNIGSFTSMHHHGWINVDVHDLAGYAQSQGYKYLRHDVRNGLPYDTGTVSALNCQHMLEHLTYKEGLSFLRECRRVLKPDGVMRVAVPDMQLLSNLYCESSMERIEIPGIVCLADLDEIRGDASPDDTDALRFWKLLHDGHQAAYDEGTLADAAYSAGFKMYQSAFRQSLPESQPYNAGQILRETIDMMPCLSLYAWLVPAVEGGGK